MIVGEESNPKINFKKCFPSQVTLRESRACISPNNLSKRLFAQMGIAFSISGPMLSFDADVNVCVESDISNEKGRVSGWVGRHGYIFLPTTLGASQSLSIGYLVPFPLPYGFYFNFSLILLCL